MPTPLILKAKIGKVEGKGEGGQICNRPSLCLSDKQIFEVVAEAIRDLQLHWCPLPQRTMVVPQTPHLKSLRKFYKISLDLFADI